MKNNPKTSTQIALALISILATLFGAASFTFNYCGNTAIVFGSNNKIEQTTIIYKESVPAPKTQTENDPTLPEEEDSDELETEPVDDEDDCFCTEENEETYEDDSITEEEEEEIEE